VPTIIKFGGYLTKFCQKQVGSFFGTPCILPIAFSLKCGIKLAACLSFFQRESLLYLMSAMNNDDDDYE